jgi:hypothetical protein
MAGRHHFLQLFRTSFPTHGNAHKYNKKDSLLSEGEGGKGNKKVIESNFTLQHVTCFVR